MKIKSQFYLFIAGLIAIPLIVSCCLLLVQYYTRPERLLVPGYDEISSYTQTSLSKRDWKALSHYLEKLPLGLGVAVIDNGKKIVFSTMDEFVLANECSESELFSIINSTSKRFLYQIEYIGKSAENGALIVVRIDRMHRDKPSFFSELYRALIIVFCCMLIFCVIMLTLIARSLTQSITALEKATRQICLGNLDEEVKVAGSNEITLLVKSLNRMRESLKEDRARRSRLIMGVSHDLRTPIALIKGYAEALYDGVVEDSVLQKKSLAIIGEKTSQLQDMVDELIDFARLDTGEWREHLVQKPIANFLQDFAKRTSDDATLLKKKVFYEITLPQNLLCSFDEKLFLRALENLTGNAMRYTKPFGTIVFRARLIDNLGKVCTFAHNACTNANAPLIDDVANNGAFASFVEICIADDGLGIAKEEIPFLFDPFYRASNSRREKGSGLGLSVVKSVIASHGWLLGVESFNEETAFALKTHCTTDGVQGTEDSVQEKIMQVKTIFTIKIPLGTN